MYGHGGEGGSRGSWVLGCAAAALAACAAARADVIVLRGGGEIQGKVITDPKRPDTVQVLLMSGRNPITFRKEQIVQVIAKASPLDDYLVKRDKVGPTAQAEFDLGAWCDQNKLTDLARLHYETALHYDQSFVPAHKKLGHVQRGDRWLTRDELRKVQGLVKYHGEWMTQEEQAKRQESAKAGAAQSAWVRRIKALRQALAEGSSQAREAEAELMKIDEPEAVAPLVKVLGNDEPSIRSLLAHVLGNIPGKAAARALVNLILSERQNEVRGAILDRLKEREEDGVVPLLVKALRSEDVQVVNRAAWALGNLDAVAAVPALIAALITIEQRIVLVNEGQARSAAQAVVPGPALMAMNQSWLAYLTGPVVGPGVAAYGASAVPFFSPAQLMGGSYMATGIGAGRGPTPKAVTFTYRNTEVRSALTRLTGQDFGYDMAAWRRWMKLAFNPHPNPVRQVPQP